MHAVYRALNNPSTCIKTDNLKVGKIYKGVIWSSSFNDIVIKLYDTHILAHTIEQIIHIFKESSIYIGNEYFIKINNASIHDIEGAYPIFLEDGLTCRSLKIAFDISDLTLEY